MSEQQQQQQQSPGAQPRRHDESGKWSKITWVLLIVGGLAVFAVCAGCLASIAIPSFMKYLQRSKTAEAEQVMTRTATSVKSYYRNNDQLPGLGETVKTTERPPTGGNKYQPDSSGLSESQKQLWQTLGWPSGGDPMYMQYTYEAEKTDAGSKAVIRASADFTEGGDVHTVRQTLKVRDGRLKIQPAITMNEFE